MNNIFLFYNFITLNTPKSVSYLIKYSFVKITRWSKKLLDFLIAGFSRFQRYNKKVWKVREIWIVDNHSLTSGEIKNFCWNLFTKNSKLINDELGMVVMIEILWLLLKVPWSVEIFFQLSQMFHIGLRWSTKIISQ